MIMESLQDTLTVKLMMNWYNAEIPTLVPPIRETSNPPVIYTSLWCTTLLELVIIETSMDEVEEFDVASTALLIWNANENELAEELSNVAGV